MSDPYDTLMDHLATLAVEAVQGPSTAVQAYWLMHFAHQGGEAIPLTLGSLGPQPSLPEWAKPYAPQARQQVLEPGLWCAHDPAALRALSLPANATGERPQPTRHWTPVCWQHLDEVYDYTRRIWEAACTAHHPRPQVFTVMPEDVWRGAALFDAGLYFACHEYFETCWGRTADLASDFYQGLIQIAVAMRHLESHNVRGASILLRAGMGRLQRYPAVYKGIQLTVFLNQLAALLHHLDTCSSPAAYQFDARQVPRLIVPPEKGT